MRIGKFELSKTQIVILAAIALIVACLICCPKSNAAEMKGQLFIPLSVRYIEDLGGAGGLGYRFPSGLMISGQISYDHFNGQSGTATCTVNCRNCQTPWSVPPSGHRGFELTIGIPLGKSK